MKNKFRLQLFLTAIFALSYSCNKHIDLNGTWIGVHVVHGDTLMEYNSVFPLVHVNTDLISYRTVGNIAGIYDKVDSLTTKFSLTDNSIYINEEANFGFKRLGKDSLSLFYKDDASRKMIFKRVMGSTSLTEIELIGKEFKFINKDKTLSNIRFVGDSTLYSYKEQGSVQVKNWELIKFKNELFLHLIDPIGSQVLHIKAVNTKDVVLLEPSTSNIYKLKRVKDKTTKIDQWFEAKWCFETYIDSLSLIDPYSKENGNTIESLIISNNSLSYKSRGLDIAKNLYLMDTDVLLAFPNQPYRGNAVWKIKKVSNTEVHLLEYSELGALSKIAVFSKKACK